MIYREAVLQNFGVEWGLLLGRQRGRGLVRSKRCGVALSDRSSQHGSSQQRDSENTDSRHGESQQSNEARWLRRLAGYCWRFKRDVIIALAGAVLYTAATLVIPLLQRNIIDDVIVSQKESVWPLAIGLLIAAAANFAGIYMRRYRGGKTALDVQHAMRTELFESLSKLDGARQDEIHTGQLVGRSISDINMVQGLLSWMPLIIGSVLLFVFSLVIMVSLSPLLSLVAVAVAPSLWLISRSSRSPKVRSTRSMGHSMAVPPTSPSPCRACPSPSENSASGTGTGRYRVLPATSSLTATPSCS